MHVRNKIYILWVFIHISFPVFSQIDFRIFPLDSFRLPDIDRQALEFSGSLVGGYSSVKTENFDERRNSSEFSPAFTLAYSRLINRYDLQATIYAYTSQDFSTSHDESGIVSNEDSRTSFSPDLRVSGNWRKYDRSSFFEKGLSMYSNYFYRKTETINFFGTEETKSKNLYSTVSAVLGFGKGRIEPVSDVAMAMFLLEDAMRIGMDVSTITQQSIYEFASLMAEVRNRRIFDFRRMRIDELRSLYSFMQAKGWVVLDDPGFFTVLTDNWTYNNRDSRFTGKRWRYLLAPEFNHIFNSNTDSPFPYEETRDNRIGADLVVEYRRDKPVNLHHDNWHSHSLAIGIVDQNEKTEELETPSTYTQINFNSDFGKNWYPNNRASITGFVSVDYTYFHYLTLPNPDAQENQHLVSTGLNAQCSYYLSYRTQLIAESYINYAYSSGGDILYLLPYLVTAGMKSNGFNFGLNVSLLVSVF